MLASPGALAAGHGPNVDEFIALHDPATSVSSVDCHLMPDSQLGICASRARAEHDQTPGVGWKSSNAYRQQVEIALPEGMLRRRHRDFVELAWSWPLGIELDNDLFAKEEGDTQTVHVRTRVGTQRLRIADRTVFNRASIAQSRSGKLKALSAVEYEHTWPLYRRHQERNILSLRALERHSETIRRRNIGFKSV
jgi:hypothetical protein